MPSRSRAANELAERIRQTYCRRCKMSLLCLMGRELKQIETYWCRRCQAWWLPETEQLVRCSLFPGSEPGQFWRDHDGKPQPCSGPITDKTTIENCPNCDNKGENPLDVIEGYVEETA